MRQLVLSVDILNQYPSLDEKRIDRLLEKERKEFQRKIVVLDDDPTGVQTVHDISVFTNWEKDTIREAFAEENHLFYLLTNSRGLTKTETIRVHRKIADIVSEVALESGNAYLYISRSDSTLRGHYPIETEALKERYEADMHHQVDGEILCPFFKEGGRYTINDIHYVRNGDKLIPACMTEFAKDKTFGYTALTMPEYIEEKTAGSFLSDQVTCISLDDLRMENYEKIESQLMRVTDFGKVIVNAIDYVDIKVFCIALYRVMKKGKEFILRTAASIVKVLGGISDQPLLTCSDMIDHMNMNGGIIIIGSHTQKTTHQLRELRSAADLEFIELNAELVKDDNTFQQELARCIIREEECIRNGKTVCCYTTRKLITADTGNMEDELLLSVKISDAVQSLIGRLNVTPSFIIAKGGITASDIGTKALSVRKARVLGQIKPGIPVWQLGEESRFPMTPYIIFPGNVGDDKTLLEVVEVLMRRN